MKSLLCSAWALVFLCLLAPANSSQATSIVNRATGIHPPDWHDLKLKVLATMSAREFYQLSGKKTTIKEKLAFSLLKGKMKKELRKHPEMTAGEFMASINTINKIGWILLGLALLGLLFLIIIVNQLPH